MYCEGNADEWVPKPSDRIFQLTPISVRVYGRDVPVNGIGFHAYQTTHCTRASIIIGHMLKRTIYASHIEMTHVMVHGLFGEHATVNGPLFLFDEPIRFNNPMKQRGNICELVQEKDGEHLPFSERASLVDFLKSGKTAKIFVHNSYVRHEPIIVLHQGEIAEVHTLLQAILVYNKALGRDQHALLADVLTRPKELYYTCMRGLYDPELDKYPLVKHDKAKPKAQASSPQQARAGKDHDVYGDIYGDGAYVYIPPQDHGRTLTPVDWASDEGDPSLD